MKEISWLIFGGAMVLFVSGLCGWLAASVSAGIDKNSLLSLLFVGLLAFVLMLMSIPAKIFQVIAGVASNDLDTAAAVVPDRYGQSQPFFEAMAFIWWMPIAGAVLLVLTGAIKTGSPDWVFSALAMFSKDRASSSDRRRTERRTKWANAEADKADKLDELERTLAELERTKHEIKNLREKE